MTNGRSGIKRVITWFVATSVLVTFLAFVWPTRYRYDRLQMLGDSSPGPVYPVRIDRFTGRSEILLPQMLLDARHNMQLSWVGATGEPLPADALAALKPNIVVSTTPLPFAQVLNPTEWRVTKIRWAVTSPTGVGPDGSATKLFDQSVFIEPHEVASLYLDLGRFGQESSITFQTAWGVRGTRP